MDPGLGTSRSKGGLPHSLCAIGLLYHENGISEYVCRHLLLILVRTLGVTTYQACNVYESSLSSYTVIVTATYVLSVERSSHT